MSRNSLLSEAINSYLSQVREPLGKLSVEALEKVIYRLEETRWKGQKVFTCGNGGSAATAIHFAADLHKGTMSPGKPPIDSESLCGNVAEITAWANDVSYADVFAEAMEGKVKKGSVLIAISGSGKSPNVLNAVKKARAMGTTTIGFTGSDGGKLNEMVDICVTVPSRSMEQIEDIHFVLCHLITNCLRNIPAGAVKF
jgi:D-sedoheptulose 7-phosphate isomerase